MEEHFFINITGLTGSGRNTFAETLLEVDPAALVIKRLADFTFHLEQFMRPAYVTYILDYIGKTPMEIEDVLSGMGDSTQSAAPAGLLQDLNFFLKDRAGPEIFSCALKAILSPEQFVFVIPDIQNEVDFSRLTPGFHVHICCDDQQRYSRCAEVKEEDPWLVQVDMHARSKVDAHKFFLGSDIAILNNTDMTHDEMTNCAERIIATIVSTHGG